MCKILIIDDDLILRETLEDILDSKGYQPLSADSGESALALLKETNSIEVALCDVKMPGIQGVDLLYQLRESYPDLEVIMLTSHNSVSSAVEAMRGGAFNYLLKPIGSRQLLENIALARQARRKQLEEEHERPVQPLQNGDGSVFVAERATLFLGSLEIDPHQITASYSGRRLDLTPTEFDILLCLAEHEGYVLSLEDIGFRLNGTRLSRQEARQMLSTHISNLRKKLTAAGGDGCIKNRRGSGYIINQPAE